MIKGKNINLRTFREKDLEEFHILDTDLSNRGDYYIWEITSESGLKKWFNETGIWNEDFGRMLIVDNEDTILGYVNYFKSIKYFSALEIGAILFSTENRKKGIATEALELFIEYLFNAKDVNRLEIRAHVDNIASQRVAEKCGFIFEGIIRGAVLRRDSYCNLKQYSLLRNEYFNKKLKKNIS
ncbi:MAG: GNAT family N-acetyltransferase [Candidatus Lokiarchaeota archaeon]|nr:GNAT family N-acetyltransferase [Candidatus Lokiarchaeota archaeon]